MAIIVFDECLAPLWFRHAKTMLDHPKVGIQSHHMLDHLKSGTTDDEVVRWIVGLERPKVVITADTGRKSKRQDPRLPDLLPAVGVPSVYLSPKMAQYSGFEKVRGFLTCLPRVLEAADGSDGARYRIEPDGYRYKFGPWPLRGRA